MIADFAPKQEMPSDALEALSSGQRLPEGRLLFMAREIVRDIDKEGLFERVSLFVALDSNARWGPDEAHLRMLLLAREGARDELLVLLQESIDALLFECRELQRRNTVGTLPLALEFLKEVLGDDFYPAILDQSGKSKKTICRWEEGGATAPKNSEPIIAAASTLWALKESQGLSLLDLREWFLAGPLEEWKKCGRIALPRDTALELRRFGAIYY